MIFNAVSAENRDYYILIKNIEMRILEKVDELNLTSEETDRIRELMLEALAMSENDLFCIGFRYGVRLMAECGVAGDCRILMDKEKET